jgi:hypothetical protein
VFTRIFPKKEISRGKSRFVSFLWPRLKKKANGIEDKCFLKGLVGLLLQDSVIEVRKICSARKSVNILLTI